MVLLFLFWLLCVGWAGVLCLYIYNQIIWMYLYVNVYIYIYTDCFGILSHRNLEHNLWISLDP